MKKIYDLNPYEKLLLDIFEEKEILIRFDGEKLSSNLEDESIKKIQRVILTLAPKEQKVLRLRYGLDGGTPLTLQKIGEILNLSRERVRQIQMDCLRKLRHPCRARKLDSIHTRLFPNILEPRIQALADKVNEMMDELKEKENEEELEKLYKLNTKIEELELPIRAYKCLRGFNISTVRELIKIDPKILLKAKNFGKKSLEKLESVLRRMNVKFSPQNKRQH